MRDVRCPILVGRAAEFDAVGGAVERAAAGTGGVVFLDGDAGMGKTRLAAEAAVLAQSCGMAVLRGRATPTAAVYRPLVEAFSSGWRDREPPAGPVQQGLRPAAELLVPAWAGAAPAAAPSVVTVGEAALALLDGLGGAGVLLVLDDLHWADSESIEVLDYLVDTLPSRPVLVVVATRTAEGTGVVQLMRALTARRSAVRIRLGPLDEAGVRAAVTASLGIAQPPPELVAAVVDRCAGSPFLVEELLTSMVGTGVLMSTGTGWQVHGSLADVVPESFGRDVADRLAALPAHARDVVEQAAVLGERFDWRLLPAGMSADIAGPLRHAAACGLLEEDRAMGGFRFRHALTRAAVLGSLLPPDRVRIARAALDAMGELPATDGAGRLGLAAQLAETAGDEDRAFALRLAVGRAALRIGAVASARRAAADALRLAGTPQRAIDARRLLLDAEVAAGDTSQVAALGAMLVAQLGATYAPAREIAEVHHLMAAAAVASSDWEQADDHLDAAHRSSPDPDAELAAHREVLRAEVALGRHCTADAVAHAHGARSAATRSGRRDLETDALMLLGRAGRATDLDTAACWFTAAVATAELSGSDLRRAGALYELGTIDVIRIGPTRRVLDARRLAAEIGAPGRVATIDLQLAVLHWKRHELDDARAAAQRAVAAGARFGLGLLVPLAQIIDGCVDAVQGHREEAVAAFDRARPSMDAEIEASGRGNLLAVAALAVEDRVAALHELARAVALAPPDSASARSPYRGLYALLLAVDDAPGAVAAVADLMATPTLDAVSDHFCSLARAVLAGRDGDRDTAEALTAAADAGLRDAPWLRNLGRRLVAEAAITDSWGEPATWLDRAHSFFAGTAAEPARACRSLLRRSGSALPRRCPDAVLPELAARGVTRREADVLALLARGLTNRDIAACLHLSPRTVEKHVERLLAKTATARRTELAALMTRLSGAGPAG